MPNQETLKSKATEVFNLLLATYGTPRWEPGEDPVDVLIGTILSANTNDVNSGRAFEQLKVAFNGNWDAVRMAPLASVIDAIRPAGMYHQKAPAIVATLEKIKVDRGVYNLDFLAEIPVDEALNYLSSFQGVGFKTASIVLLFCFNRAAFPVDTHIQRISQRIGISGRKANPDKIRLLWESLLPPETYYPLHINFIHHGRRVCQAQKPRCELCSLQHLCDYFNDIGEWQTDVY